MVEVVGLVDIPLNTFSPEEVARMKLNLADRYWRLNNLYKIKDKSGKVIIFKMNFAQEHFYRNMHSFNIILKARQHGFTTLVMIFMFDSSIFNSYTECGVIAQNREVAGDIFNNKVKFAWGLLDDWVKDGIVVNTDRSETDSARKLSFNNGSSITVSTGYRGGTLDILHVSEFGETSNDRPAAAEEIVTGAFAATPIKEGAIIIVESTAKGQSGQFYDLVTEARAVVGEPNLMQPKLFFYPWFVNPEYTFPCPDDYAFTPDMASYFEELDADLSLDQCYWYVMQSARYKNNMYREFPSTVEECFLASVEGALWDMGLIDDNRVRVAPDMVRIVVSIDPATTNNKDSDETGILVIGIDSVGHCYVLEDRSGKYTPSGWASIAIELYHKWEADRVVAETNQGGDMVETTLRSIDEDVSYKGVHASKGKYARAEPVSALYEQGRVHHVGRYVLLESQMISWSPNSGGSPDRVDALVWGITELVLVKRGGKPMIWSV